MTEWMNKKVVLQWLPWSEWLKWIDSKNNKNQVCILTKQIENPNLDENWTPHIIKKKEKKRKKEKK